MRLDIDIGNSKTKEWDETRTVELDDYRNVFTKMYPNIPYPESLSPCLALHKHKLILNGGDIIYLSANYSPSTDDYTIAAFDQNESNICQAMGKANAESGSGLSLIFTVPGANYPVNVTIRP